MRYIAFRPSVLGKQGRTEEARAILEGECVDLYDSLNSALNDIIVYNMDGSDGATKESASLYKTAVLLLTAILIAAIMAGVFFSFVIVRLIRTPIAEIENAAIKLTDGDLDVEISYASRDELGVPAAQVSRLIHKLQVIIDDENKFLAKMAEGDFTVDSICEEEYTGAFHPLLVSFRGISEKLNDAMLQITKSSSQVAGGADQVSDGAQALIQTVDDVNEMTDIIGQISAASIEQADSISLVTAGIDQISSVVQTNSATAEESAAASKELLNQSQLMRKLVEKFRLKSRI